MAKVLLVEDDRRMAKLVYDWLCFEKYDVDTAYSGFDAWEQLQASAYDLVILDWDLPDIQGIDILKRLRAAGVATPVLMLTGRDSVDAKELGLDSGADDYLTKPFHVKELSARIRTALRKSGAAQPFLKPLGSGNEAVLSRADLSGTSLAARYEFTEVLGEGGIGIVFKARHPLLRKFVAIKMLQSQELKKEPIARFEIEAQAASRLDHPGIATIYDFGLTERAQPFMVMEFFEGDSLQQVLQKEDHLSVPEALEIFSQVADALAHAHEMGILHRDIKPSNIMLKRRAGRAPVAKILDFGCAKLRDLQAERFLELSPAGQVLGSPPYMSPEQVRGQPLDERSDIYSLGCVIYLSLSGYAPHVGDNSQEIMIKHLEEDLVLMSELSPELGIPAELEPVVAKALAREPADRYQSMLELKQELERARERLPI